MFRLAHLSDPHLGPLPQPTTRQLASKRLFGYINWRSNRHGALTGNILDSLIADLHKHEPDHIAVTGDLVNLALPAEIANARIWLKSLGAPDNVSAILGNHDAYVPGARLKAEQEWAAYMRGDEEKGSHGKQRSLFPYLRIRDQIAIIGVNSARATLPLMATGYFLTHQARQLKALLEQTGKQGLFRTVMIHHPPCPRSTLWYKRLIGASRFRQVVREAGAELVLHGHTHLATRMTMPGPDGHVPVICVPSASQGHGRLKPAARYNLFEISGKAGDWHCTMIERGHTAQGQPIAEIGRHQLYGD